LVQNPSYFSHSFIRLGFERHLGGSVHHLTHLGRFRSTESALKGALRVIPEPAPLLDVMEPGCGDRQ
jgi:hypothetical protein